ncbi:M48 family metalloprotease, partial [Brevundimonas sp.]|uniref:M48 family metalloprotease n=1 Tax=Brevundimonas sp. TaxID=1871086 RepID=UPI0035671810
VCAILAGCGSGPTTGSISSSADGADAAARLTALTNLDQRVADVGLRLLQANTDLCPVVRQSAGWALHAASQYSVQLQPHARARFGLERDLPGVLSAPSTSAAADAGLREGDLILAVNGAALNAGPARTVPVFEGLAANIAVIDGALARGSTRLDIRRDGEPLTVTIEPRRACGYEVQLNPSDELNARADGRRLFISTALAGFTQSDDELALILGHELAHHVLRHRTWSDVGGAGREANAGAAVGESGDKETQADRVGLFLAARAGYDTRIAPAFWRRFGAANWRVRYPQLRHASAEARARALEQVQVEIETQRASGQPILP